MYEVDDKDKVVELKDLPQSSIGAPIPIVLAGEHDILLTYYLENRAEDWDGTSVRIISPDSDDEPVAIVKFKGCYAHMFGPPNDEAFSGHPLNSRGLQPYGNFKIENSSWIRNLEKMNSVHSNHDKEMFLSELNHFVFSFHDTTFECIAKSFEIQINKGSVIDMIPKMLLELR